MMYNLQSEISVSDYTINVNVRTVWCENMLSESSFLGDKDDQWSLLDITHGSMYDIGAW